MTDEEANDIYKDLLKYYGDKLADADVYPKIFEYQVKLYKYYNKIMSHDKDE